MASRFWVGGTGTWDASDTTHWASSSGGAGGASVPGTGDTATFDGSSGGGTVTVNTTVAIQSITMGAFTGTLDFSANNNDVTLSASNGFSGTGTGTRTLNLGDGTWTLSSNSTPNWNLATTTNLTFSANSSTIQFTSTTTTTFQFQGGGLTYNNLSFASSSGKPNINYSGGNTFNTLTMAGPAVWNLAQSALTVSITTWAPTCSISAPLHVTGNENATAATVTLTNAPSPAFAGGSFRSVTFDGAGSGFTATNSFDYGATSGLTITAPASAGGGGHILGGSVVR